MIGSRETASDEALWIDLLREAYATELIDFDTHERAVESVLRGERPAVITRGGSRLLLRPQPHKPAHPTRREL